MAGPSGGSLVFTGKLIGNPTCGCAILTGGFTVKRYPMATKNAHWQAAFRRRMREAGLKAMTVWLPKEGADRLARYPEKERGEIITRALVLLESQGELTGEPRGEAPEDTLTVAELSTRLKRVEALLSTITSESTGVLTGDEPLGPLVTLTGEPTGKLTSEAVSVTGESTDKSTGEEVVALSEAV
jgi:hypothetical protein